jgi:predicted RNA-binding protein with EMAP domain
MDYDTMTREQLIAALRQLNSDMENVIVVWGDQREYRAMFQDVAENANDDYTQEETKSAKLILETPGAFERFIELIRESFDRGGINYAISENISFIMQEVAQQYEKQH